jgi:hypothetical protein
MGVPRAFGRWEPGQPKPHRLALRTEGGVACPQDQRLSERLCGVLAEPFPSLAWVFLSRSRHAWVADCPASVALGGRGWRTAYAIRDVLRSQVHAFRRQDGRETQLHPKGAGLLPIIGLPGSKDGAIFWPFEGHP